MRAQSLSELDKIKDLESKILTLAEMYAFEGNAEEKIKLAGKIDNLHQEMYNRTRWAVRPKRNVIVTETEITYIKGNTPVKYEEITVGKL